jgi:hypothetical protein
MRIIAISMRYDIRDNNVLHDFYIKFGEMKTRGGHGRTPGLVREGAGESPHKNWMRGALKRKLKSSISEGFDGTHQEKTGMPPPPNEAILRGITETSFLNGKAITTRTDPIRDLEYRRTLVKNALDE